MTRKLLSAAIVFTAAILLASSTAFAIFDDGTWCDVLARAYNNSSSNYACQGSNGGQDENALTNLTTSNSSATLKNKFISAMAGFEKGQHFQRVGAAYIEAGLGGGDWAARVNQSAVTLVVKHVNTCTYAGGAIAPNTGYDPETDRVVSDPDCGNFPVLFFTAGGSIRYAIKEDCGNPLGRFAGLPPLPPPPSHWQLSGKTKASVGSVYAGDSVRFTSSITNDKEGGQAVFAYGPRYFYSNTSNPTVPNGSETGSNVPGGGRLNPGRTLTNIILNKTVPANTAAKYLCGDVAFSPYNDRGGKNGRSRPVCVAIVKPNGACKGYTISPSAPEPGQQFQISGNVGYASKGDADQAWSTGGRVYMKIIGPSPSNNVVKSETWSTEPIPSANYMAASYPTTAPPYWSLPVGIYSIEYGVAGSSIATANQACPANLVLTVAYTPYFNAVGGDISAGADFGTDTCTLDTTADIKSWNNDNSPPFGSVGAQYRGAGSQYAAFAGGRIDSFITNAKYDGSYTTLGYDNTTAGVVSGYPHALSFSISGANDGGRYGGGFGQLPCMHDYLNDAPGAPDPFGGNYSTSGTFSVDDGFNVVGAAGGDIHVSPKTHLTIISDGDVFISSNIYYDGDGNIQDIPKLTIIARGGIYVGNTVKEIHGTFEANSSDAGKPGVFATCATRNPGNGAITETTDYGTCSTTPLDVYGSVLANSVDLDRSWKSLNTGRASETFHYSPEGWLPTGDSCTVVGNCKYNVISSLPPIL